MPNRNEILGVLCSGFLMLTVGVVWLCGPVGLIFCGSFVFIVGFLLGFVPQPKNNNNKKKEDK